MKNNKANFLRSASNRINSNPDSYNWKAIGACNCGNLVQEITNLTAKEISNHGIKKHGDWQSISILYKKDSSFVIDEIITEVLAVGFDIEDFTSLENLSDSKVLAYMGEEILQRDCPKNAARYMNAWADMIEGKTEKVEKKCVKKVEELELA